MTGDAVRWTYISTANGDCNPSCRDSTRRSEPHERATISPGVVRNSAAHQSDQPHGNRYPSHKPHEQQSRLRNQRQLFFSFNEFLQLVLKLLSHCLTSTKRLNPLSSPAMSSPAATHSSFHCSGPRAGRNRRGFYTSLLVVYAFSSSFAIVSAHAATDDFIRTSTRDKSVISSAENSVYNEFGDSDYNYGDGDRFEGHYTPTWAVHIPGGDVNGKVDQVARDHGFINLGKIFDDHYHFHHNSVSKRSVEASHHHQRRLEDDERVRWSKQQQIKSRKKRDFIRMRPSRTSSVTRVELNDPKWPQMWYLNRGNGLDMNVIPAWEQGITGKGVVVTILDDGLESDHPDLEHNYDPKASYDVNSHDDDPMPHYDMTDSNRHGTRCAGEVAATANNSLCSVGIAFGARVGGVRMLDGDVTDAVEARSLSLNPQHIDIYSASWGPDDDGKTVDGPGELATRAFIEGVTKGRNGKGSIFIWASGNGGRELDNCNCDGYTNSIWTLSISSATEEGHVPWYSEKCSSTLATTYSSGGQNEKQVVTTDLHHSCTTSHTGTSASAPLAAGIVALVLEANRNLTWRDLQHIVVRTSKPVNLKDPTWITNGVGRRVSHSFGYGLLDAAGMVNLARTWQMVPEQQRCEINAPHVEQMIPAKRYITLQLTVKHCMGVNFLEHVQAKISLTSQRRGDIVIYLQSPAGTRVTLLTSRVHDVSRSGFNEWPFMSVHTWGEAPHGNWLLEVHNEGRFLGYAVLKSWSLIFYGTAIAASKNDPISVRPTDIIPANSSPPISFHHQSVYIPPNMNKYPVSVFNKPNSKSKANQSSLPNSGNSGRKQQQQQNHKISPYGTALSTPKKNGKNSKNNAQTNGGKSNSKGSTSNRPLNSQTNSQQSGKNNLYRVQTSASGGKLSTGISRQSSSTTARPKFGNQQSVYNANIGSNRGFGSSSAYKPEKSRGHEKVAIKAPKQIKDNNAYRINTGSSTPTADEAPITPSHTRYEPNPRIPKLFQQYDKIEQIFPEFHPYTGGSGTLARDNISPTKPAPNKKQFPYYPNSGSMLQESNTSNNRGGGRSNNGASNGRGGGNSSDNGRSSASSVVVVTNPKPSRENSKKNSSPSSSLLSSSSSSSASFSSSSSSSLSSSQNFQNEERDKQTEGMYIPNRKNTKAQITQWDLIFYGTDKPPQPDDPIQIKPGPFGSYGGDIDNNFLVPETMGQWRDLQQVGESHVDVQRTTNDQTNTACTNFIAEQKCIECAQGTFLYKERCWAHCPEQSYMIPEVPRNYHRNKANDDDYENIISVRSILNTTSEVSSIIEPNSPNPPRRAIMKPIPQKKCASCHSTCLLCRGPEGFQCIQCHSGYHLTIISSDETYCYPATNGNNLSRATGQLSVNEDEEDGNILDDLKAFWSVVVAALVIMLVVLSLTFTTKQIIKQWKRRRDQSYERVAFDAPNEEVQCLNQPEEHQPIRNKRECPGTSQSFEKRILVESSSDSDDC